MPRIFKWEPSMNLEERRAYYAEQVSEIDATLTLMNEGILTSTERRPGTGEVDTTAGSISIFERQKAILEDIISQIDERLARGES